MSGFDYVKIDSWHVVETTTRGGGKQTYCGRYVGSPSVVQLSRRLPLGEKSCETCARLVLSQEDPDNTSVEPAADTSGEEAGIEPAPEAGE